MEKSGLLLFFRHMSTLISTAMQVVEQQTRLDAPIDRVWNAVNTSRLLLYVARPMVRFSPITPASFPERWEEDDYLVRLWLFGVLPFGKQTVSISRPASTGSIRRIRDNGHSALIRRWDHLITLEEEEGATLYTDRIEIEAGVLTPLVAGFADVFYAHRQRRWHKLIAADFNFEQ